MAQAGETLAGRIAYLELGPLQLIETGASTLDALWLRGGFPENFAEPSEAASLRWRQNFIRTYLERDIPLLGPRLPPETCRRLWTMLAHLQGGLLKLAALTRGLGIDVRTTGRYLDLLVDLLLVRRLPPWNAKVSKRLVRSPKVQWSRPRAARHRERGRTARSPRRRRELRGIRHREHRHGMLHGGDVPFLPHLGRRRGRSRSRLAQRVALGHRG